MILFFSMDEEAERCSISSASEDGVRGGRGGHWDSSSESEEEEFGVTRNSNMHLYCEVCGSSSSSVRHLQMHLAGSKHKKKLEMAGLSVKLTDYIERPKNLDIWKSAVRCILCKVIMMGAECLIHAKSTEHTRKLSKMSQRNNDFYTEVSNCFKAVEKDKGVEEGMSKDDYSCGICKVELSGMKHLELHLSGKKHQKKAHWLRISNKESNSRDYKQVWCSLCRVFVNNLESFEGHIRGKQHIKMLKRAGVKWKVLVDSYGENTVGAEVPIRQVVKRESYQDRCASNHAHHEDRRSSHIENLSHSSSSEDTHHTPNSYRSPEDPTSSHQFPGLPESSWGDAYSSIPEYNPNLPRVLREGKGHTEHRVIYHNPLLAVGYCLDWIKGDDPRLGELEQATRSATLEREAREREEDRGRGWEDRGRDGRRRDRYDRYDDRSRSSSGYRERRRYERPSEDRRSRGDRRV